MRKSLFKTLFQASLLTLLLSFYSCQDDSSTLGLDILPSEDILNVLISDTTKITASTVTESLYSYPSLVLLGSINDNLFGETKAGFIFQYYIDSLINIPVKDPIIDAATLSLKINNFTKTPSISNYTFNLYELTDSLSLSKYYTSDYPIKDKNPNLISSVTVTLNSSSLTNSILKFNISLDLAKQLITSDTTTYKSLNLFTKKFKGFYIEAIKNSGNGLIAYIDYKNNQSNLLIKYHTENKDSLLSKAFIFYKKLNKKSSYDSIQTFNIFEHNYTNSVLEQKFLNSSNDSLFFSQDYSGKTIKISFSGLQSLIGKKGVAINKAELIIKTDKTFNETTSYNYLASKLLLYQKGVNGDLFKITDNYYYDSGVYDSKTSSFTFIVTMYIQELMENKLNSGELFIIPKNTADFPSAAILKNNATDSKMVLKIKYNQF